MRANVRSGTGPEVTVRSALHRAGMRFRKDLALDLPGGRVRPDIVFTRARLAVFVDGCFWHSCPIHATRPRANAPFWAAKLDRNAERDRRDTELLRQAGWKVLRLWEHDARDPAHVVSAVTQALIEQRKDRQTPGHRQ